MKIGNRSSALERVARYVEEHEEFTGSRPARVVLFDEDFKSLGYADLRRYAARGIRIVPGPSIQEYDTHAIPRIALRASEPAPSSTSAQQRRRGEPRARPVHLGFGGATACGMNGFDTWTGPLPEMTTDPDRVTCRRCCGAMEVTRR